MKLFKNLTAVFLFSLIGNSVQAANSCLSFYISEIKVVSHIDTVRFVNMDGTTSTEQIKSVKAVIDKVNSKIGNLPIPGQVSVLLTPYREPNAEYRTFNVTLESAKSDWLKIAHEYGHVILYEIFFQHWEHLRTYLSRPEAVKRLYLHSKYISLLNKNAELNDVTLHIEATNDPVKVAEHRRQLNKLSQRLHKVFQEIVKERSKNSNFIKPQDSFLHKLSMPYHELFADLVVEHTFDGNGKLASTNADFGNSGRDFVGENPNDSKETDVHSITKASRRFIWDYFESNPKLKPNSLEIVAKAIITEVEARVSNPHLHNISNEMLNLRFIRAFQMTIADFSVP